MVFKGIVQRELTEVKNGISQRSFIRIKLLTIFYLFYFIFKFKENLLFKFAKNWFQRLKQKYLAHSDP